MIETWKRRARELKADVYALDAPAAIAASPGTPARSRYALWVTPSARSILIPEPHPPILGYLDDLVLIPLGVALVVHLVPPDILAEHRARARATTDGAKPKNWIAAGIIVVIWLVLFASGVWLLLRGW